MGLIRLIIKAISSGKKRKIVGDKSINGSVAGNIELAQNATLVVNGDVVGNISGKGTIKINGDLVGKVV